MSRQETVAVSSQKPEATLSIDIVICTYNNAVLLDRTLAALFRQRVSSAVNWQVLVVNNNCTDETSQVVARYADSNEVALTMILEPRQGLHYARACGAQHTNGEWIAYVDDDCLLAEDWIEQAARFVREHPGCGAFGGQVILDWEAPPPLYARNRRWAFAGKYHGENAQRRAWLAGTGMVVRRTALQDSGWLDHQFLADRTGTQLISGGDMEMGLRIAAQHEIWYAPACKLQHVIPARRLTRQYVRRIVFGLGASRHHVRALTWRGTYPGWLLYATGYSLAFGLYAVFDAIREIITSPTNADIPVALAPVLGWWAAMWAMLRMESTQRRALLGCAAVRDTA